MEDEEELVLLLSDLTPNLPKAHRTKTLQETLDAAKVVRDVGDQVQVLKPLEPYLVTWANHQPAQAHKTWQNILHLLATRPRPEFLNGISTVATFMFAIIDKGKRERVAEDVFQTIWMISSWWP